MKSRDHYIIPEHRATSVQLHNTITSETELAGILSDVVSHDLRRGVLRDIADLNNETSLARRQHRLSGLETTLGMAFYMKPKDITQNALLRNIIEGYRD